MSSYTIDSDGTTVYHYSEDDYVINTGKTCIEIDLGQIYNDIDYIRIWHRFADGKFVFNHKLQTSIDGVTWVTLYDSTLYQPNDIQNIYMLLSSNKTYHTTYCNVLNAMINEAKDLVSVKAITYGMEITDEKYLEVMTKINESKDALLTYVEKKFTLNKSNSENPKEESNNE